LSHSPSPAHGFKIMQNKSQCLTKYLCTSLYPWTFTNKSGHIARLSLLPKGDAHTNLNHSVTEVPLWAPSLASVHLPTRWPLSSNPSRSARPCPYSITSWKRSPTPSGYQHHPMLASHMVTLAGAIKGLGSWAVGVILVQVWAV
jgi:hypothetical protein